jgi:hypothetical protein
MKKKSIKGWILLAFLFTCIIIALRSSAQGTLPGDPDTGVPLDGGLSIAIVAGVSYGVKRLINKREKKAFKSKW